MSEISQENQVERLKDLIAEIQKQKIALQLSYNTLLTKYEDLQKYTKELEESFNDGNLNFNEYPRMTFNRNAPTGKSQSRGKPYSESCGKAGKQGMGHRDSKTHPQKTETHVAIKESSQSTNHRNNSSSDTTNIAVFRENTCKNCLNGTVCRFGENKCWFVHPPKGFRVIKNNSKDCCSQDKQTRPCRCNRTDPEKDDYLYELIPNC